MLGIAGVLPWEHPAGKAKAVTQSDRHAGMWPMKPWRVEGGCKEIIMEPLCLGPGDEDYEEIGQQLIAV